MKNFKWPVALLAFALTLTLSVGLVYLRQRQLVNEPLLKRISELEPVKSVELQQEGNQQIVFVTLDYMDDLSAAHRQLHDEVERLLGAGRYRLEIQDGRTLELEAAFAAVHLALYEGEQRGNFTEMGKYVADELQNYGVNEHRLIVDREYIYLQMREGDAYLFEIIPRAAAAREGVGA